jgi:hypothetical protein
MFNSYVKIPKGISIYSISSIYIPNIPYIPYIYIYIFHIYSIYIINKSSSLNLAVVAESGRHLRQHHGGHDGAAINTP